MARQYELILLGATGYTGKLVAEWVSTHLPEDLKWAIAGRNTKKLQAVVDELTRLNPDRKQPDIETCELKKEELDSLAQKTKLIITTVGPFMFYGEPVLSACVNNGTHYLDSTGEVPWYYDMIAKYDSLAKENNSIIIPQCGLDSVPADILAFVLAREVRKRYNAPCERVIMTLYDSKTGVSGGTSLTVLSLFDNYSLSHLAKSMHPYSLSPIKADSVVGAPKADLLHSLLGLKYVPELGGVQTTGPMAAADAPIVHRSWGLYQSDPALAYGPKFRFNEYMRASNIFSGAMIKLAFSVASIVLAIPPVRWMIAPLIKKFLIPKPGEGPTRESMKNDFISYRGVGIAEQDKGKVTAKLDCAHGGYAATAITLSAAALLITRGNLDGTEAGRLGGGILTPATLGEQYVANLSDFGMKIQVDN
ncbi:hypothetical protein P153DRAFT_347083 [Dothidotthia symphoricarpi CBS 119687]|uniref:Saccharopine dehydrogenase NADP binding domain-containing protein n=1 Tax=Dothidotthia symphoricarpi CBS 119687 TaxID=1392245 RepID=A0A6A6A2V3_9PLEO|nr:uncharacterized protein P153DRAFT_347083 [Dothidotthia symphoricarpi CBS 119687]KAF2126140.1 hypothetical protein P153DRAFT_347083 [Dothidotthia symphoricarpi CBS 119687]